MGYSRRGRVRAPELRGRGGWINTGQDLSLAALKGKVVLLDFWTFCCINCLHVLEELRPLEERFGDALVVIGVHSPKFEHEKDHAALERAVARYDVRHPVLDDPDRATWDQYGIRAWPTLVLVDPGGYAVAAVSGEGNAAALERVIAEMIEEHRENGSLNEVPVEVLPPVIGEGALRFPGKVASGPEDLLAVADSGHNRVAIARVGEGGADLITVAGTGARGRRDGKFSEAEFVDPQGLVFLDAQTLLVADTGNHRIRHLDLSTGTVSTVAGTGDPARWGASGGPALETALNSPWDLERWNGAVAIAMAGSHQLWVLDLDVGELDVLAGSGVESLVDGPARTAAMAQPSGLSSDGERLWIPDSETSSLRYLDRSGHVHTVVGTGLFDFGYEDGPAGHALLQHPLGVVATPEGIVVCDTYNSALRRYDVEKDQVSTLSRGDLSEPSGAALLESGDLVITDTNNHRLVRCGPDGRLHPFQVRGLEPPVPERGSAVISIGPVELTGDLELSATLPVPDGQVLDASLGPPVQLTISSEEFHPGEGLLLTSTDLPATAQLLLNAPGGYLDVQLRVGTCEEGLGAVCNLIERRWRVEVQRDVEGSPRLNLGLAAERTIDTEPE